MTKSDSTDQSSSLNPTPATEGLGSTLKMNASLSLPLATVLIHVSEEMINSLLDVHMPVGHMESRVRDTRCTDRFVRYPYPKLFSNYKQNYPNKASQCKYKSHKDAFNLEKEAKIINPHRMEKDTTHGETYKGRKGPPAQQAERRVIEEKKPIVGMSSYSAAFPNWQNGRTEPFIEKAPQYPVYSIPFAGDSTYKQTHTDKVMKDLIKHKQMLAANRSSETSIK